MSRYAIGVDFGTESGRAVLVDVADGRQLATAVYPYSNGVIDERLPLRTATSRCQPDWALQDPEDYLRVFQHDRPGGPPRQRRRPGGRHRPGHRLHRLHDAAHQGRRHAARRPARAARQPHAWVKLWKHHAAQPEADRLNETAARTGRGLAAQVRRQDQLRVVLLQGPPDPRRGPRDLRRRRPPDRGRRLGRLAADRRRDPQPDAPPATRRCGRSARASRTATTSRRSTRAWRTSSTTKMTARHRARMGERAGGLTDEAAALDRPATPAPPSPSRTSTRMSPCRPSTVTEPGPDGHDHGHQHLPHGPRRRRAPRPRHLRLRRGRHPARALRLRGRPELRRRPLRLVRRARACPSAYSDEARERGIDIHVLLQEQASRAAAGRVRPAGARLVERQPLGPRGRRAGRPAGRARRSRPRRPRRSTAR